MIIIESLVDRHHRDKKSHRLESVASSSLSVMGF
jgi:hypothetical protein